MKCEPRVCIGIAVVLLLSLATDVHTAGVADPSSPEARFFVALNGNDAWTGKLASPDSRQSDGPFATPARAVQAVRALLRQGGNTPITVLFRDGTYELDEPLTFGPDDSGTFEAPVTYASYPGEKTVLSAGRRIGNWQRLPDGRWQTVLTDVAGGKWYFEQLFVNGQRRYRPRLPKGKACYYVAGEMEPTTRSLNNGYDRFRFQPGLLHSDWSNLNDIEVLTFHIWTMSRLRVADIDETNSVLTMTGPTRSMAYYCKIGAGQRYLLENVREALTEPGEWYLDRSSGLLTYIPRQGESPRECVVTAPRLEQLVRMQGDVKRQRYVEHLELRDLEFSFTNWTNPDVGYHAIQAEAQLGAAITARAARNITLNSCRITHTGQWALEWGNDCTSNTVKDCVLADLGAGGVKIGELGPAGQGGTCVSNITVSNNLIAHGGRLHPAGIGVWISHSPHNRIVHNTIDDFYYTGVSLGWTWGYGQSFAHDNLVAHNRITRIGQGVLSDMGGIYTLGVCPGTVLEHNCIEHIRSFDYGGWGIYFDEGTSGAIAQNNVVSHTRSAGFHQHYGRDNLVTNNIFAFGEKEQIARTRAEDHLSFRFLRNIVLFDRGKLLGGNWNGDNYRFDSNLYWDTSGRPLSFAGTSFTLWQKSGQDVHSLVADPRFVDAADGNFRLQRNSPAHKLGFQPILISGFGATIHKTGLPPVPAAFTACPPSPQMPVVDDFEGVSPGSKVFDASTSEEAGKGSARVTTETAFHGSQCLKFTDAPHQNVAWTPNIHYRPHYTKGRLRASFALRVEPGAVFYHEWRDGASPYHVGPSLHIGPAGTLTANGERITTLTLGQWARFEIECGVGKQSTGSYRLAVWQPAQDSTPYKVEKTFSCDRRFRRLDWFGFVSDTTQESVVYLDDLRLERIASRRHRIANPAAVSSPGLASTVETSGHLK